MVLTISAKVGMLSSIVVEGRGGAGLASTITAEEGGTENAIVAAGEGLASVSVAGEVG